ITREASFRAREAFISPSAPLFLTLALASRLASASAAMALWSCMGSFTSLISTRSTLIPQSSVASWTNQSCTLQRKPSLCCCTEHSQEITDLIL
uniref:Uncharacterized protein n=1 Tax=Cyprinodon variegatus TaxID=28743 RepID=A0A3Q2D754_CYPVA